MLRSARHEDADAVASVIISSRREFVGFAPLVHTDSEVREWVRSVLIPAGAVVVLEQGQRIVGVLSTSISDGVGWVDQLYLSPGFTGHGLGSCMLRHAHSSLPRPIRLYTFQANHGARRFYERHGYQPIAFTTGSENEEQCPDVLYELAAPPAEA